MDHGRARRTGGVRTDPRAARRRAGREPGPRRAWRGPRGLGVVPAARPPQLPARGVRRHRRSERRDQRARLRVRPAVRADDRPLLRRPRRPHARPPRPDGRGRADDVRDPPRRDGRGQRRLPGDRDPLRRRRLGRRVGDRRPGAPAPPARRGARRAGATKRAGARTGATPGRRRGAHPDRPRPARLRRARDQRHPRAGRGRPSAPGPGSYGGADGPRHDRGRRAGDRERDRPARRRPPRGRPHRRRRAADGSCGAGHPARAAPRHRGAGLEVEARVVGEPRALPPALDQAAFRILQESLTNAARHGTGEAELEVVYGPARLELTVRNPLGEGAARGAPATGHGILGMRERAALLDGALDAGLAGDAFRVHASLPYVPRPRE
jgi:hypothetical protein